MRRETHIFRGLIGRLVLSEGSSLAPLFLFLGGDVLGASTDSQKYPFAKYPFVIFCWEVLNGVGVDGVGVIFPFFYAFSFFFTHFFVFFSLFFVFLRFSLLLLKDKGKQQQYLLQKRGISLRPRLHRPRAKLPDSEF